MKKGKPGKKVKKLPETDVKDLVKKVKSLSEEITVELRTIDHDSCKNCDYHFINHDNKFCPKCGQSTDIHRINWHFLIHEIQHSLFHVDKGIFYSIRELFTRPGHSIRDYLNGKRQNHFKPMMLVLILGTISGLLIHFLSSQHDKEKEIKELQASLASDKDLSQYIDINGFIDFFLNLSNWFAGHFAFTILILLPVTAYSFFIGFRKYLLNYVEWLVIMLFLTGQILVVYIPYIFIDHFFETGEWFFWVILGMSFWSLNQLFNNFSRKKVILSFIKSVFINVILASLYCIIIAIVLFTVGLMLYGSDKIFSSTPV